MTTPDLESVMRAIYYGNGPHTGEFEKDLSSHIHMEICARAALEALREPSEGALTAGETAWARADDDMDDYGLHETIPQTVFKAMIDHILEGNP